MLHFYPTHRDLPLLSVKSVPWSRAVNYMKKEMSVVGEGSDFPGSAGKTVTIKQCSIGTNCSIGNMTKLNNCVIMDNVVIGEK